MGYEILDSKTNQLKYYVLPWENNTQTKSISNVYGIPGYTKSDITQQFHTHPVGVRIWGSLTDVKYSQYWKLPVNVISSQGTICRLFVPSELRFNNENADYGNIIYKKP